MSLVQVTGWLGESYQSVWTKTLNVYFPQWKENKCIWILWSESIDFLRDFLSVTIQIRMTECSFRILKRSNTCFLHCMTDNYERNSLHLFFILFLLQWQKNAIDDLKHWFHLGIWDLVCGWHWCQQTAVKRGVRNSTLFIELCLIHRPWNNPPQTHTQVEGMI